MITLREVHHQAERCRRLRDREQQMPAAKLFFVLLREWLGDTPSQAGTDSACFRLVQKTEQQAASAR